MQARNRRDWAMRGYYENQRDDMIHAHAWHKVNDHFMPHFHSSVELVYVLEGELAATQDGVRHTVGAGTLLINSSYVVHSYETPAYSSAIIAIIPMNAIPSARRKLAHSAFASPTCADDGEQSLRRLMEMMVQSMEQPLVLKGLCYTIIGLLMERVGLVEGGASRRSSFIYDVMLYLQEHYAQPLSVEKVAAHFGYSRSRFSHLFNEHLGYTLTDCVNALRCSQAAQLLQETEMSVSEVAMAVGFESLRTFYRVFRKQYKMTPFQYSKA